MREWFSNNKKDVALGVLFFLVSTISFALGYLVAHEFDRAPIIIQQAPR